ncbi:Nucleotidyltransferase domain-containing protein [Bradyrhizobium sp. Rc2d]|uniref:nucleotidyltransferase domain-containing protein n=1 Tax=Bradyrhizobium sp. Rc2d TaxID=1855321 RepID=UPI000887B841|nr:nucleotidyltransferase domain-containing protein [Bradyrhizobium sp. Rc2d]SDG69435.1 Nucleotidyltransferase domain-containing protein [Bradyrhizobium sp. Rc2d]
MNALELRGLVNSRGWRMMSEQDYLNAILMREQVGTGLASPALFVPGVIRPVIEQWAGRYLLDVTPSGSYAKGTANKSGTDLDLFISLSPDTAETLSEVHKTWPRP